MNSEPTLELSDEMCALLQGLPDDVRESDFLIPVVNRAADDCMRIDQRGVAAAWITGEVRAAEKQREMEEPTDV